MSRNIILFASGNGSNVCEILSKHKEDPCLNFVALICDNYNAPVISRIDNSIPIHIISPKEYSDVNQFENRLVSIFKQYQCSWAFLCGYRKVLSQRLLSFFYNQKNNRYNVVNIHPSPLPLYPGLNSYKRMFDDNLGFGGVTLHFVDEGIDTGEIIFQEKFDCSPLMNIDNFIEKGQQIEYRLYDNFIQRIETYE